MDALFVGELQEHALAFRFLEALAVAFEELVRSALALDADEQRLLVVDALAQFLGAFGEEPAGGALEKQKRRPRLELGVAGDQVAIPFFERTQVFLFFARELLEDRPPARILRERGGARVELEAALLGRDRHAKRVAREHELGRRTVD